MVDHLSEHIFGFLTTKYVQQADTRQQEMGLQYTTAETHDLADEMAKLFRHLQEVE